MTTQAAINADEAAEIIHNALRQSRCTGKTDMHFALAILAGEILRLKDSLRECLTACETGLGELPGPVVEDLRLVLDLPQPCVPPADQL